MSDQSIENIGFQPGAISPTCPNGQFYTIKSGDTMFFIAKRFNISLQDLINNNPQISDPNTIFPGQVICIPLAPSMAPPIAPPMAPCPNSYQVVSGDTMFQIAKRYGISLDALIAANPQITDPNLIFPGQEICIPLPPVQGPAPMPMPLPIPAPVPVPIPIPQPGPCYNGALYTVRSGDTLFDIARSNNISLAALVAANPQIPDPNLIYPGQVICIPLPPVQGPVPMPLPAPLPMPMPMPAPAPMPMPIPVPIPMPLPAPAPMPMPMPMPAPVPMPILLPPPVPCFNGTLYMVKTGDTLFDIARANNIMLATLIAANPQIPDPNLIYPGQVICIPSPAVEVPVVPPPVLCPMPQPVPMPMPMPAPVAPIEQPAPMPVPVMPCQPGQGMMYPTPVYIVVPWDECPHRNKQKKHERRKRRCR